MSQRIKNVKEDFVIELKLKVTINSFSNHNGFKEEQLKQAIEEFSEEIQKELEHKLAGEYYQQEFLESVDFVSYNVEPLNGL
jgi:NADPH-dependent 7-cyano-7-deazaguanine reductase QueF